MARNLKPMLRIVFATAAVLLAGFFSCGNAIAHSKLDVIHDFCAKGKCSRSYSTARLIVDQANNIYGTRDSDGKFGRGTVFKVSFDSARQKWLYSVLHNFCSKSGCADGADPTGPLIDDASGNLYGTASTGGATNHGVLFEISPDGSYQVVYSFCPDGDTCPDGTNPFGSLAYAGMDSGAPYDGVSALYGIAGTGGVTTGPIAIFELDPSASRGQRGSKWTASIAYILGVQCFSDGVRMDGSGRLYGTTQNCGDNNVGLAFVLSHGDSGWSQTAHYSFCNFCGDDGYNPRGTLVRDAHGNFYGTTQSGGKHSTGGTVFKLTPLVDTFVLKTLYSFGEDGVWPFGGLLVDSAGNFYGTLYAYGRGNGGNVFELSGHKARMLYHFCLNDGCKHGKTPEAGLVFDQQGNLWGTTTLGGKYGFGTLFELKP